MKKFLLMFLLPLALFAEDSREINGTVYARLGSMKSSDFVATNVNSQVDHTVVNTLIEYKLQHHVTNYIDSVTGKTNTIATTKWVDDHNYLTSESDPNWATWRYGYGVLLGFGASATSSYPTGAENYLAIGKNAAVSGAYKSDGMIAVGSGAHAYGLDALAVGVDAVADDKDATAIGHATEASNVDATSIGHYARSYGTDSTAVGHAAIAGTKSGGGVHPASSYAYSTAVGSAAQATQTSSTALGYGAKATATKAMALGVGAQASSQGSVVIANGTTYTSKGQDTFCVFQGDTSKIYFGDNTLQSIITGGGGGTSDYTHLTNKPKINSVELNGNKSLSSLGIQSKLSDYTTTNAVEDISDYRITNAVYSGWYEPTNTTHGVTNKLATVKDVAGKADKSELAGKQDKLPYATNAIPAGVISGAPWIETVTANANFVPWVKDIESNKTAVTIGSRPTLDSVDEWSGDEYYYQNMLVKKAGIIYICTIDCQSYVEPGSWESQADYWREVTIGVRSFTQGYNNVAGVQLDAEGDSTHAEGNGTHAEGDSTHAEGDSTHAEGDSTHAEGIGTHAEGDSTHAEGNSTHAEGYSTHAGRTPTDEEAEEHEGASWLFGTASHAAGWGAEATNQTAFAWQGIPKEKNAYTEPTATEKYYDHGAGTYNINPVGGLSGFYIGEQNLTQINAGILSSAENTAGTIVTNVVAANSEYVITANNASNIVAQTGKIINVLDVAGPLTIVVPNTNDNLSASFTIRVRPTADTSIGSIVGPNGETVTIEWLTDALTAAGTIKATPKVRYIEFTRVEPWVFMAASQEVK